ncbi:MAG TPA: putative lipopolysaccharide heptosyltransferase III [Deltaproteobacteria bacterium]|nr:MAG: putative lipopolysaccharide heptosyltransferase III [Deltaproteobacteria bacterium GWA2_55_82]OGQ64331.1 MAG: putative lipopolysaccharide heptosyltransferase III [Deltaproteobacteria bacterium RIFCSPLOWO2_02_FULL_55_12]OIJ74323.1 MAG: putative lipopolysaccharide heptosyltransferase III [Deltaproteobacteria bacterium GWC2_55_46]HBG46964.1 putative lipopolysaccharide heptosyltransferase III [Deltaproteobacteria bacterium]HCY10978.1 putative lipopolysaccharide heptosyltransferase III [Delt
MKANGGYPDLTKVRRALVIVFKNIGDVLLTTPVFSALKRSIAGVEVDALVNRGTEEMLTFNPDVDRVLVYNRKTRGLGRLKEELRLVKEVRGAGYDMAVALTSGDRSRNFALLSGAGIRVGAPKKNLLGQLSFNFPVTMASSGKHYVERNLDCLRRIGIFPERQHRSTSFFEGSEAAEKARGLLAGANLDGRPYMVVHPTSRWMFKSWPPEKNAALIDLVQRELGMPVVLTSGPEAFEISYVAQLKSRLTTDVTDFTGKLSLKELGAVIRKAVLFFGVDSAPMHISAAVGTPAVALFGPSFAVDWAPWGDGHRVVTSDRHSCVPCGKDGCGGGKVSDCLVELDVRTVYDAVREMLGKSSHRRSI